MGLQRSATVQAVSERSAALSLAKGSFIGLQSGE